MFETISPLSRVTRRISRARAHHRLVVKDRPAVVASRNSTSFGESIAIGLGCDHWKPQPPRI